MTGIIAVDLAAKFSAACWISDTHEVWDQWDSWKRTATQFINETTCMFDHSTTEAPTRDRCPTALIVEDLPARVPWMTTVRDVCRLQGRLIDRMTRHGHIERLVLVQPETWRSYFPGLERGTGADAVVPVAAELGYTPPDLTPRIGKGEKATARKVGTDYCAAYLIGRWATDFYHEHGHFNAPRVSRFTSV